MRRARRGQGIAVRPRYLREPPGCSSATRLTAVQKHPTIRRLPRLVPPALTAAVLGAAGYWWASRPVPVALAAARLSRVADTLVVSGQIHGTREAELQPARPGVVERLLVREGEPVRAGQLVAQVVSHTQQARLTEARAALRTAEAELARARRPALEADVERARAGAVHAEETARERLERLRQDLRLLEAGSRTEEIDAARAALAEARAREQLARLDADRQERLDSARETERGELDRARADTVAAQAQVEQSDASLADARRELDRLRQLFGDGAIARANLDRAETAVTTQTARLRDATARAEQLRADLRRAEDRYRITRGAALSDAQARLMAAREAVRAAEAKLRQAESGARPQELESARAAVREAEADLRGARRTGQAQVETLLALPRTEDVLVAQRRVEEARRALETLSRDLADGLVRAPFAGHVAQPVAEPGETVGAGSPVLRLVEMSRPEIRADTDERHLGRLRVGLSAMVALDSFPERPFRARVSRLAESVDPGRGTLQIILRPEEVPGRLPRLHPHQTVSVTITLNEEQERVVVPTSAVTYRRGEAVLFGLESGRAQSRAVRLGTVTGEGAVVLSGLSAGNQVISDPRGIRDGQAVRPR